MHMCMFLCLTFQKIQRLLSLLYIAMNKSKNTIHRLIFCLELIAVIPLL